MPKNRQSLEVGLRGWRLPLLSMYDLGLAALAVPAAFLLRDPEYLSVGNLADVAVYSVVGVIVAACMLSTFDAGTSLTRYFSIADAINVIKAAIGTAALTAVAVFLLTRLDAAPRSLPILHAMLVAFGWVAGRSVARMGEARRTARRQIASLEPVEHLLVVGANRLAWFYVRMVNELAPGRHKVVGILDQRPHFAGRSLGGSSIVGTPETIAKLIGEYKVHGIEIDRVILAEPLAGLSAAAREALARLAAGGMPLLHLEQQLSIGESVAKAAITFSALPGVAAERAILALRPFWLAKRAADIVFAATMMVTVLPLLPLLALITAIDVGLPILFWQRRVGRDGRGIVVYKFRTLAAPFTARGVAVPEDRRLSSIGRMARKCRLDEIPQLWSILRGDMSLVGPRPLLPIDQPSRIGLRLMVSPGLTGYAQINGGKLLSIEEKNACDEWYVRHASLRLDAWIMIRTARMMLTGDRRDEVAIAAARAQARDAGFEVRRDDVGRGGEVAAFPKAVERAQTDAARRSKAGRRQA